MKHQIDPKTDCVFKAIPGSEKNKNLLIHFINGILELKGTKKIIGADILNPYNEREFTDDKLSVADVKAKDLQGNYYQIEVQLAVHGSLTNRKAYHLPFHIQNRKHRIELNDHLSIHIIQLPQWQYPDQNLTDKDRWLYLFKEGKNIDTDDPPEPLKTEEMKQAMKVMKQFSENQKDYLLYQSRSEGLSVIATWKGDAERAERAKENAIKERDAAVAAAAEAVAKAEAKAAKAEKTVKAALKKAESEAKAKKEAILKLKQTEEAYKKLKQRLKNSGQS